MAGESGVVSETRVLPADTVVIAGGGPVGLILARVLSFYGVRSVLFERNATTTSWPKMDLTNARSMELLRKIGLADELRKHGVPAAFDQDVLVSTGLSAAAPITAWRLPGVDKMRAHIRAHNDGTQPQEPWQRMSQAIFERVLKAVCEQDANIELHYSHKVERVEENHDHVKTVVTDAATKTTTVWQSRYVAGCDGANSKVRTSLGLPLDGGPIVRPSCALLVHFQSQDLARLYTQGRFWHIFFVGPSGGFEAALIAQDEKDTFTTHLFLPLDGEPETIGSEACVYRILGGLYGDYPIQIDRVLVRSVWRPNIAVARTWQSPRQRVFLAGDAAHQNIPTGGYGMNMGIGDAFDLGWKLAAVVRGQAGAALLTTYEQERRPVALRNVTHAGRHFQVHQGIKDLLAGGDPRRVDADTDEGRAARRRVHEHYQAHDGENKDLGVEMGFRYTSHAILREDDDARAGAEPPWSPRRYVPTTWPGSRAPHLFLSDGTTAIFDTFGRDWALAVFAAAGDDVGQGWLVDAARRLSVPLTRVDLAAETQAAALYEKKLVLVRPDHHVAWRGDAVASAAHAHAILQTVTGHVEPPAPAPKAKTGIDAPFADLVQVSTQVETFHLEKQGDFQR